MSYTVDLQKIANTLDFDLEDVEMLIEVFLDSANENLQTMKNAIETNDIDVIFKSAHAIKGSSANLTLKEISDIAQEIETNARAKKTINYNQKYEELRYLIKNIKLRRNT